MLLAGWLVTDKKGLFSFFLRQVSKVCSPDQPQILAILLPLPLPCWDHRHVSSRWALRVS